MNHPLHPVALRFLSDSDFDCMIRLGDEIPTLKELLKTLPAGRILIYCEEALTSKHLQAIKPLQTHKEYTLWLTYFGETPSIEILKEIEFQDINLVVCMPSDKPTSCRWFPWIKFNPDEQIEKLRKLNVLNIKPNVACNPLLLQDDYHYCELTAPIAVDVLILDQANSELATKIRTQFHAVKSSRT